MKKVFFSAAFASMMIVGCQNENIIENGESAGEMFTLQVEQGIDSRTEWGQDGSTSWSTNDKIYVTSEDGTVTGVLTYLNDGKSFKGFVYGGHPSKLKHVLYPVPENGDIKINQPKGNQIGLPMMGELNNDKTGATLDNLCAMVKMPVSGTSSLEISDSKGLISGHYEYKNGELIFVPGEGDVTIPVNNGYALFAASATDEQGNDVEEVEVIINGNDETLYTIPVEVGYVETEEVPSITINSDGTVTDADLWNGKIGKLPAVVDGVVSIKTAEELAALAKEVNEDNFFSGITIKLIDDIDLNNHEWTPIGAFTAEHGFMGNFDGNGYVIKNLKISNITPDADGYVYAGLFGVTEGTDANNENYIKNLTIENVDIDLDGHIVAAAIAYPHYTTLENIKVKGNVTIKGGHYTSGVLAYTRRCVNAKDITIEGNEGSSIQGLSTVGGVISDIQMNGGLTANYSNFAASGLTIKGNTCVGGISGIIGNQKLDGATVKSVTIVGGDARTGIVAGAYGATFDINNITNVIYEYVIGATNIVGAPYKTN